MTDLNLQLEAALDRLPEPVPPPFDAIADRAHHRRQRQILSAGVASAAVIVAAVLVVPRALPSDHGAAVIMPAQVGPSPTLSQSHPISVDSPLAASVTANHTGTAVVELGAPPRGTNAIELELTCQSSGAFSFGDGAADLCHAGTSGNAATAEEVVTFMRLQPGQHSTTVNASAGLQWQLVATYVKATPEQLDALVSSAGPLGPLGSLRSWQQSP